MKTGFDQYRYDWLGERNSGTRRKTSAASTIECLVVNEDESKG